ncbi:hypothetical protein HDF16_000530 [Granulicella aggregans]|uniref:Uncharacterized protein n=1 Tax=Granulicella aggregans TaxID=474949 RepID=A0A7W8E211_9BACT|nr:hypothetical protein [Granulicella aggregans]MBB5055861.1 hypothetical protein [Granulicella aggregans]
MKTLIAVVILLLFGASASSFGQADGILRSLKNATLTATGTGTLVTRTNHSAPVEMTFTDCQGIGVNREHDQWWILPINAAGSRIKANKGLWILPVDAESKDNSWYLELSGGDVLATKTEGGLRVVLNADSVTAYKAEARPHSDPFRNRFSIKIGENTQIENALAGFYWGTMLPSVVEKTMAANFRYSSGYVLSTLNTSAYAGSYPAVDHEFQIKGRLAMGSEADLDIVKRMIELQFKLMDDDPEHLSRAPTSVQPDGSREYHVRRSSIGRQAERSHVSAHGKHRSDRRGVALLRGSQGSSLAAESHRQSGTRGGMDSRKRGPVWASLVGCLLRRPGDRRWPRDAVAGLRGKHLQAACRHGESAGTTGEGRQLRRHVEEAR